MAQGPSSQRPDNKDRAEQFGANAGRRVGETFDRARDAGSATAEKLHDGAEGVMRRMQDAASNVAQSVRDSASGVTKKAEDAYEATTETISEFTDDAMQLIRRHPFESVLIGFGVGCFVGAVVLGSMFAGSDRD